MEGYDASTYGDRFAEVYDDWYGDITDTEACVEAIAALVGSGTVLELGVGTGRLAVPLAGRGLAVTGIDSSAAMLDRLAVKPGGERVTAILGDMTDPPGTSGGFAVAFVAYNTLFNLIEEGAQQRCLTATAALLADDGALVVEAFVPDPDGDATDAVTTRRVTADQVVLSVSRSDPARQELLGQYVDITEQGISLRPWHIRWATTDQLDAMAETAGLRLDQRWSTWGGAPFGADSPAHISLYRRVTPDR